MDRSATTDPLVGQLLDGRYRVGERIARGGMATVYEATDLRLDRLVAIKVMPHALAEDETFSQRFVREARAAARLTHPNVVAVYDQGDDNGTLFLAMEYVAGRHTLRDLIRDEAPLPPTRALSLMEEILKAIAAAHESGIIHRDVKPENVLINPRGQIKVADFGLARAISSATTATATGGVLMGTVSYLPPELVTDGAADARSDVYSLGVLLFEMLTGRKPHAGDSPIQIAYKHVHDDVPPPSSFVPDVPPYLDAFVARATARQRDLRPADAHVMLQQLRRVRHALDNGVLDDQELTDDLTPTIAISAHPEDDLQLPPDLFEGAEAVTMVRSADDDVFDFARFDDFDAPGTAGFGPAVPMVESTAVVGQPARTHDTIETPVAPPLPAGARGADGPLGPPAPGSPASPASPARPKRKKGGWIAFIVVLLLAAGAAMGGWWYGVGRFKSTPDVVSLTQSAAQAQVEKAGLTFQVTSSAYSEKIAAGHVLSTDPGPGDRVERGGVVEAVISKGPERHDVPDVGGKSESVAIAAIKAASLTAAPPKRAWSATVDKGVVISVSPSVGTPLKRAADVQLVISRGPKPIRIVDYTGKSASQAETELTDLGFKVRTRETYNDNVAQGLVIRQSPKSGQGPAGTVIRLVVSRGPHLVKVPDVDAFGVSEAEAALTKAGFKVEVRNHQPYFGLGFVVSQSPEAGTMAPYGSTVIIEIV
ncbi:MAG: PASTA domain-containing protein [Nocardioidaceae bacterium]